MPRWRSTARRVWSSGASSGRKAAGRSPMGSMRSSTGVEGTSSFARATTAGEDARDLDGVQVEFVGVGGAKIEQYGGGLRDGVDAGAAGDLTGAEGGAGGVVGV